MVQLVGATREEADAKAQALIDAKPDDVGHTWYEDERHVHELWRVRESGLGATAHVPGKPDTWEGWEDSAVPVDRLGDYLRDLKRLYEEFDYGHPSVYGHFGHGCVHTRIPFDLESEQGIARMRAFVEKAADLVVSYGGSLSGEHGDGQSRGELLDKMFGPELIEGFERLKGLFDPENRMNPGKIVLPYRLAENLRLGADYLPWEPETVFSFPHDDGKFSRAAARCVGVGKCRSSQGGVMCPSYRATREEEHSTRGRSRLLFEMVNNDGDSPLTDGWRSDAVHDALDLCLACKGCKTDCPVNVDMATYKAEFLHHHYQGRLRPLAHYSMGWLPAVARVVSLAPRTVNALTAVPWMSRVAKALGGIAPERDVPVFAEQRFTDWWRERGGPRGDGHRGEVVVWPDTFTDHFHPAIGRAAVEVLEAAGFRVKVPEAAVCCGLTWISTGQLDVARRVLGHTIDVLREDLRRGTPVVGLEPSCTAVFRADAAELLPKDPDVDRLRRQTRTLAELLVERAGDWQPPRVDARAVVQRHCHQCLLTAAAGFGGGRGSDRAGRRGSRTRHGGLHRRRHTLQRGGPGRGRGAADRRHRRGPGDRRRGRGRPAPVARAGRRSPARRGRAVRPRTGRGGPGTEPGRRDVGARRRAVARGPLVGADGGQGRHRRHRGGLSATGAALPVRRGLHEEPHAQDGQLQPPPLCARPGVPGRRGPSRPHAADHPLGRNRDRPRYVEPVGVAQSQAQGSGRARSPYRPAGPRR